MNSLWILAKHKTSVHVSKQLPTSNVASTRTRRCTYWAHQTEVYTHTVLRLAMSRHYNSTGKKHSTSVCVSAPAPAWVAEERYCSWKLTYNTHTHKACGTEYGESYQEYGYSRSDSECAARLACTSPSRGGSHSTHSESIASASISEHESLPSSTNHLAILCVCHESWIYGGARGGQCPWCRKKGVCFHFTAAIIVM